MSPLPATPRPTPRASRRGLVLASLAAAGALAAAVAIAGFPAAPAVDASVSAATSVVVADPSAGPGVVYDTVYLVSAAPPTAPDPAAAAPITVVGGEPEGDGGHEAEGGDN